MQYCRFFYCHWCSVWRQSIFILWLPFVLWCHYFWDMLNGCEGHSRHALNSFSCGRFGRAFICGFYLSLLCHSLNYFPRKISFLSQHCFQLQFAFTRSVREKQKKRHFFYQPNYHGINDLFCPLSPFINNNRHDKEHRTITWHHTQTISIIYAKQIKQDC